MGWSYGKNSDGREIGYSVQATCDQEGCSEKIDRGLAYACGNEHGGGEYYCDRYFCYDHLDVGVELPNVQGELCASQLCETCSDEAEKPDDEDGGG